MAPSEVKTTLSSPDGSPNVELPIYKDTIGPDMIDIHKLYGQAGKFTYDSGFMSTASRNSKITYIDGDEGELLYRGYTIDDLANKCDFVGTYHLLLKGELPSAKQKEEFNHAVTGHTVVHEQMQFFLRGFRHDTRPMTVLTSPVGAMNASYPDATNINNPRKREISQIRLIVELPTLVTMVYRYSIGQPLIYSQDNLLYTGSFIRMMLATLCEDYGMSPVLEKALGRIFILHADHEQNASTSTVRLTGSSGTNPITTIAAGIVCLRGPAHGGANEATLNILEEIGTVDKVPGFIKQVRNKNSGVHLMSFGHRVYKNYGPCVKPMRGTCHEVLNELGLHNDPLFKLVMELEKTALEDEYFISHKLYPNVNFCSDIVQRALGIPTSMLTCIFMLTRSVDQISQREKMITNPKYKTGHPRQLFNGAATREVPSIDKR